jgi:hypothetical protein
MHHLHIYTRWGNWNDAFFSCLEHLIYFQMMLCWPEMRYTKLNFFKDMCIHSLKCKGSSCLEKFSHNLEEYVDMCLKRMECEDMNWFIWLRIVSICRLLWSLNFCQMWGVFWKAASQFDLEGLLFIGHSNFSQYLSLLCFFWKCRYCSPLITVLLSIIATAIPPTSLAMQPLQQSMFVVHLA